MQTRNPTAAASLLVFLAVCSNPGEPVAPGDLPVAGPISALIGSGAVPPPVTYWPADGDYLDVADGDNHGTPLGGVSFAPGRLGQAFALDGTGEIEVSHSDDLELASGSASMTIAAWVKPVTPLPDGFHLASVVSFNYACTSPVLGIHVTDALWAFSPEVSGWLFGVRDESDVIYQTGVADVFLDSDWHHVVAVRDGPADGMRLYVDGQLRVVAEDLSGAVLPVRNALGQFVDPLSSGGVLSSPDRIGAIPVPCATKRFFVGLIDEIKVWNLALSDDEVEAVYHPDGEGPIASGLETSPNPVPVNSGTSLTALVDDVATGATVIATASYSVDGGSPAPLAAVDGAFDELSESVVATLPGFAAAGVYDMCVRGTDARGNQGSPQCGLLAVYDPTGGFVTGGGWIQSLPGALPASPALSGRAVFAFVSRYAKGATLPSGTTQFKFQVGGLEFDGTTYDWLVIAGARAQYKGRGTINGAGDYGFMLTAIDGQASGGGGTDRFRIKIWDQSTSAIIYDNQSGDADNSTPATVIGAGNILVHPR